MSTIIKLSKPIKAHNQELTELELREPTGDDVIELGYPYLLMMPEGEIVGVDIRPRIIYNYISRLAAIPLGSAKQIALHDLAKLQAEIMGFFGEGESGTLTSTSD